ncbi:probable phosphatidylinositol 4-phosphate 5-kinase 1 [Coccomyxa sp. Obi]|nr:probable phosphatidylinositol 4-phosphate 5-kinase 1 [Coccomyxa sp. Obi]
MDTFISKLFRRLSLKLHPDKQPHAGPQPFQQLQKFYSTKDVLALLATALKDAVDLPAVCEEVISDCERIIKNKYTTLKRLRECLLIVKATDLKKGVPDLEEFVYKGAMEGGKPHGRGKMEWASGKVYDGEWLHAMMGTFMDWGRIANQTAMLTVDTGRQGELQMSDGGVYSGSWYMGKRRGNGVEKHKLWSYDGQWLDDKFHGWGMYNASGGYSYCGCWKAGKRKGFAIMCSPDGSLYRGTFLDNLCHGHGEQITLGTGYSYFGSWHKGEKHGRGIERDENHLYDGQWCSGLMHGLGMLHKGDRIYEGQFAMGKPHGYGVFSHVKGVKIRFAGHWENGNPVISGGTSTESYGHSFKKARLH